MIARGACRCGAPLACSTACLVLFLSLLFWPAAVQAAAETFLQAAPPAWSFLSAQAVENTPPESIQEKQGICASACTAPMVLHACASVRGPQLVTSVLVMSTTCFVCSRATSVQGAHRCLTMSSWRAPCMLLNARVRVFGAGGACPACCRARGCGAVTQGAKCVCL